MLSSDEEFTPEGFDGSDGGAAAGPKARRNNRPPSFMDLTPEALYKLKKARSPSAGAKALNKAHVQYCRAKGAGEDTFQVWAGSQPWTKKLENKTARRYVALYDLQDPANLDDAVFVPTAEYLNGSGHSDLVDDEGEDGVSGDDGVSAQAFVLPGRAFELMKQEGIDAVQQQQQQQGVVCTQFDADVWLDAFWSNRIGQQWSRDADDMARWFAWQFAEVVSAEGEAIWLAQRLADVQGAAAGRRTALAQMLEDGTTTKWPADSDSGSDSGDAAYALAAPPAVLHGGLASVAGAVSLMRSMSGDNGMSMATVVADSLVRLSAGDEYADGCGHGGSSVCSDDDGGGGGGGGGGSKRQKTA